jgi:hypothetical protein
MLENAHGESDKKWLMMATSQKEQLQFANK